MTAQRVRTRFAPSPTGSVHLGSLRTALFAWLWARHSGGDFVLRIEDTDTKRFVPGSIASIMDGLRWLGLDWDEGPDIGGRFGPYTQSQRGSLYRHHAQQLMAAGKAYRCFCPPERLRKLQAAQRAARQQPKYDGACRDLPDTDAAARAAAGEPFTVRLRLPAREKITVPDVIRGDIVVSPSTLSDPILIKSDGMAVYHLAAVVDDHCMQISHVLRGEEWISTAPYHVLLYEAFGWDMPVWVHLPVILNPDGKGKMSKRHQGAQQRPVHLEDFVTAGILPDAMFNFLSLLGWTPDASAEIFTRQELIDRFELHMLSPSAAQMPYDKLDWMNGEYLRRLSPQEFRTVSTPFLARAFGIPEATVENMARLDYVLPEIQTRVKTLGEVSGWLTWAFQSAAAMEYNPPDVLIGRKLDAWQSAEVLETCDELLDEAVPFEPDVLRDLLQVAAQASAMKLGSFLGPVRGAISGSKVSPPLFEMMATLGPQECQERIRRAHAALAAQCVPVP